MPPGNIDVTDKHFSFFVVVVGFFYSCCFVVCRRINHLLSVFLSRKKHFHEVLLVIKNVHHV